MTSCTTSERTKKYLNKTPKLVVIMQWIMLRISVGWVLKLWSGINWGMHPCMGYPDYWVLARQETSQYPTSVNFCSPIHKRCPYVGGLALYKFCKLHWSSKHHTLQTCARYWSLGLKILGLEFSVWWGCRSIMLQSFWEVVAFKPTW